jgi:plasmid stabilization system protein ParE
MNYRVEMTARAEADLDRLLESLGERSPKAAARLARNFWKAMTRLGTFPLACGLAYESRFFPEELRHLLFEARKGRTYRALFVVRDDLVKVLAIRAPGERPVSPDEVEG